MQLQQQLSHDEEAQRLLMVPNEQPVPENQQCSCRRLLCRAAPLLILVLSRHLRKVERKKTK